MNVVRIDCAQDPRTHIFSRFSDAELKRGFASTGPIAQGPLFIAESRNVIARALASGVLPAAVFTDDKWFTRARDLLSDIERACPGVPVYLATPELFKQVTGYAQVRGLLAAMHRPAPVPAEELLAGARRVAVLENVGNYTNIGAIFRSAAALGVDAVLLTPSCHDPLYRRAARVSMGTVFQVPWGYIGQEGNWSETGLPLLARFGFATAALALCEDSLPLDAPQLAGCNRLAMVLGTEGDGLAASTIAACDYTVRIPMAHGVDSLNVAAASAVAFWELRVR